MRCWGKWPAGRTHELLWAVSHPFGKAQLVWRGRRLTVFGMGVLAHGHRFPGTEVWAVLRRPLHTFPRVPPLACLLGWCAVKQGGGVHLVHPHFVLTAALWVSHCDSQLPQEAAGLTKFRDLARDCRLRGNVGKTSKVRARGPPPPGAGSRHTAEQPRPGSSRNLLWIQRKPGAGEAWLARASEKGEGAGWPVGNSSPAGPAGT